MKPTIITARNIFYLKSIIFEILLVKDGKYLTLTKYKSCYILERS